MIYDTRREEQVIKEEISQQIADRIKRREALKSKQTSDVRPPITAPKVTIYEPIETQDPQQQTPQKQTHDSISAMDLDWINTQFQLGQNYEFANRSELAVESYIKIIRKYPNSKYAERARKYIQALSRTQ